jgi:hypothetical protein
MCLRPGDDDLEGVIQHRLKALRVNAEARRRLDEEQHSHAVAPPVKSLKTLLAEPNTPICYRIAELAPPTAASSSRPIQDRRRRQPHALAGRR